MLYPYRVGWPLSGTRCGRCPRSISGPVPYADLPYLKGFDVATVL